MGNVTELLSEFYNLFKNCGVFFILKSPYNSTHRIQNHNRLNRYKVMTKGVKVSINVYKEVMSKICGT
jgi:hypothetical protein